MYICPMHPKITSNKPSRCSICGMKLVKNLHSNPPVREHTSEDIQGSYTPLFIIVGLILLSVLLPAVKDFVFLGNFFPTIIMSNFMAGFFLVFSGFKLLDLKGFADGYSTYDLIAKKFYAYGYIYPFIELILGLSYLLGVNSPFLHLFTFIVMIISGLGVAIKLAKKESFQCACLGTFLKVPLTKITLVEDFGMAVMALAMLVM